MVNLPINEIKKRKNLTKIVHEDSRICASDDLKLEPIDDAIEVECKPFQAKKFHSGLSNYRFFSEYSV